MKRRSFVAAFGLAPIVGAFGALVPGRNRREDGPAIGGRRIPNVRVQSQDGKWHWFYDDLVKGKMVLINFMYGTCEGSCPLITANLLRVQKLLGDRVGKDIFFYSISLKPTEDSPEVLRRYAEGYGVKPGWLFLTGEAEDMERLRVTMGFTDPDPILDAQKDSHVGVVLYGNEPLERWAACPGLTRPELMAEYIRWVEPVNARAPGERSRVVRGVDEA